MNKTILVVALLISLSLSSIVVGEEDFPILDKQIEIRQAHLAWLYAIHEIGLKASIDYIDVISNGTGVDDLNSYLSDFQNQYDIITSITTHVGLNNAIRQIKQITKDFRQELRSQITTYSGNGLTLLNEIKLAIEDNQTYIDGLESQYWTVKKTNDLDIFDMRVDRAQDILDKLKNRGYNITEAQNKLNEIIDKRTDLEAALDQKDYDEIGKVLREIHDLSKELRRIVQDLQIDIPTPLRTRFWIRVGERVLDRTSTIINELERLGIETSELKQIHSNAQANLTLAQDLYESGDINGSIDALHDLKANFIELKETYLDLIFGEDLTETLETAVELTSEALDRTIDEMDKTI
jgi:hypothetical protein